MTLSEAIEVARQLLAVHADAIHEAARLGKAAHIDAVRYEVAEEVLDNLRRVIENDPRDHE